MDAKALLTSQLGSSAWLLGKAAEDLNDADFLAQLPGEGQTANWIYGHLATSEDWFMSKLTGSSLQISADDHERYKAGQALTTDPGAYLSKADVLSLFQTQRERTLGALSKADTSSWDSPAPEGLPPMMETVGSVWGVVGTHSFWHLGQVTAIRRMLGKPPMFQM